jgi:hypothetical protein
MKKYFLTVAVVLVPVLCGALPQAGSATGDGSKL